MSAANSAESALFGVIRVVSWILYAIFVFACIVLAFAFALLVFGADPSAGFAEFIYESAARFMDPFRGMIEPTKLGSGGLVSWSSLFAIAFYLVLIWLVSLVAGWAARSARRTRQSVSTASAAATGAASSTTAGSGPAAPAPAKPPQVEAAPAQTQAAPPAPDASEPAAVPSEPATPAATGSESEPPAQ